LDFRDGLAVPSRGGVVPSPLVHGRAWKAGGTYSSGSNYARCQYSNGDSYTCNTDVNQCETCTNGKCTVAIKRPGMGMGPAANMQNARPTPSKPARPAPAMAPAGMMHKHAQ
jgi:hypothetical protein